LTVASVGLVNAAATPLSTAFGGFCPIPFGAAPLSRRTQRATSAKAPRSARGGFGCPRRQCCVPASLARSSAGLIVEASQTGAIVIGDDKTAVVGGAVLRHAVEILAEAAVEALDQAIGLRPGEAVGNGALGAESVEEMVPEGLGGWRTNCGSGLNRRPER
jgi:hypothetical protein